ncbi:hypothetical protein RHA1_ro05277 [Rhodococcus jostii RHA1]|uniref:Uncharacterized protein n=1 Tax=Rhodococcus jostii (strain RHA1) TaxID=101510 RepID=Q0S5X8_RHOJR|nr:hypothetical protein RHA1_ro05277 [Rhodococcus jostii RHA1]
MPEWVVVRFLHAGIGFFATRWLTVAKRWSFWPGGAKFRFAQWAAPAAVTGAQEFGRCSAVRREEGGSSNQRAQRRVTELREDEPIRWPDPSPLSSWWDRVVWGARGSAT